MKGWLLKSTIFCQLPFDLNVCVSVPVSTAVKTRHFSLLLSLSVSAALPRVRQACAWFLARLICQYLCRAAAGGFVLRGSGGASGVALNHMLSFIEK